MTNYSDPRLGFHVSFPEGWAIHADERAIQIGRPDGAEFVVIAPFTPAAGLNSDDPHLIAQLPAVFPQLFPGAQMTHWTPAPMAGGNGVGALAFRGAQEWGEARAMCARRPDGGGLAFVIAAPQSRFEADKAGLIAILDSLQFGPPAAASQQPIGGVDPADSTQAAAAPPPDPAAAQRALDEAAAKLTWTRWTDPRETAFSVEVPVGWIVDGGLFRFGLTDPRSCVQTRSPDGDIVVQTGDPGLMLFTLLTPIMMQMGQREGQVFSPTGTFQSMVANYLPPRLFARWYIGRFLANEVDGVAFGVEQDLLEASQRQTQTLHQNGFPGQVEVGQVEFTGVSKRNSKKVFGHVLASLTRFPQTAMGGGSWSAQVMWSITTDGDIEAEARKVTCAAVLLHLMQSWQDDPVWSARNAQQQQEILRQQQQTNRQISQQSHQMAMDNIAAAGERSRMIARQSEDRREAMMSAFRQRNAARDETQRHFVNYVGDRTDVRDGSGQAWNVGSGYRHYYRDPASDAILGTDSPNGPGVDWTPLHEF